MSDFGNPGYPGYGPPGGPPPGDGRPVRSYLVWSILATLFCCLPAGVVSIVYASQVSGKQAVGDIAGAQDSSRKARLWLFVSVGIGLGFVAIYLVAALIAYLTRSG